VSRRADTNTYGGVFVAFEGGEGSGKTTQAKRLALRLRAEGHKVVLTREPGGTPLTEEIRRLLLEYPDVEMCQKTELFLYLASRAEHVEKLIAPSLRNGSDVVCDRFSLASIAYQGGGRGLGVRRVRDLCNYATDGLWPDMTFLLDVEPGLGLARKAGRGYEADRLEREDLAFHHRVRAGYLGWARSHSRKVYVLPGELAADVLEAQVWNRMRALMRFRSSSS
jgi:dTMP kinase